MAAKEVADLPSNTTAALTYVLGIVSGIFFWATKKDDEFIRFHAIQSIGLCVAWICGWIVLTFIPVLGWILLPFWSLLFFVFWLVSIVKAYQGEKFKLPVIGPYIQKFGKQVGL
jgi:uncharacterized membrane protein